MKGHCSDYINLWGIFANLALNAYIHGASNIYVNNLKNLFHLFPSIRNILSTFKPIVLQLFIVSLLLPVVFQGHQARRQRFDGLWQNRSETGSARNSIVLWEERVRWLLAANKAASLTHAYLYTPAYTCPDAQVSFCKPTTLFHSFSRDHGGILQRKEVVILRIYMNTRQWALFSFACVGMCQKLLETLTKVGSRATKQADQTPKGLHYFLLSPFWVLQAVVCSIFGVGIT